ncbi:MAG: dihydrolipoamide acetyltransferase family protein [Thermoleophilia bacterium]
MVVEVFMPQLGLTMDHANILEWTKSEGDKVEADEPLLLVETDKAATEVPSPASGILGRIVLTEGDEIPVGTILAYIAETEAELDQIPQQPVQTGGDGSSTSAGSAGSAGSAAGESAPAQAGPAAAAGAALAGPRSTDGARIFASPRARMRAAELGVDLATVTTAADRIIEEDVLRVAEAAPTASAGEGAPRLTPLAQKLAAELGINLNQVEAPAGLRIRAADLLAAALAGERETPPVPGQEKPPYSTGEIRRLGRVRRITAERMAESSQTAPQVTYTMRVDMTKAVQLRAELKEEAEARGTRLSYDAMFVRAVATALPEFPELNAQWVEGEGIRLNAEAHVGVAVDLGSEGLIVPVIRNAHVRGLLDTAAELRRLVGLAREGRLGPDDYKGGTFTVTNLGLFGVEYFTPIVNLPEAAILGIGALVPTPALEDGRLVERQTVTLSLTADHRIVDGAPAARFLARIKELMERPLLLLERGL